MRTVKMIAMSLGHVIRLHKMKLLLCTKLIYLQRFQASQVAECGARHARTSMDWNRARLLADGSCRNQDPVTAELRLSLSHDSQSH